MIAHKTFDTNYEVLTDEGWRSVATVRPEHHVATMLDGGEIQWGSCGETGVEWHEGDLVSYDSNRSQYSMAVQGCHEVSRLAQASHKFSTISAIDWLYGLHSDSKIAMSGQLPNQDLPGVDDDSLELLGWVLTDGCITSAVSIYQSKPIGVAAIRHLLVRMGLSFTESVRNRQPRDIDGVAVKTAQPDVTFRITGASRDRVLEILGIHDWHYTDRRTKAMPGYVRRLSKRQFDVFFNAVVDGDGTRVGEAICIYGTQAFLSDIQSVAVLNGWRCALVWRNRNRNGSGYWALNITPRGFARANQKRLVVERGFEGAIYHLSPPTGNLFVRHAGRAFVA